MNEQALCLALLKCDAEDDVINLLKEAGYWGDRDAWRYFGDLENNRHAFFRLGLHTTVKGVVDALAQEGFRSMRSLSDRCGSSC